MKFLLACILLMSLTISFAHAQDEQVFSVGQILSDGKDGRAWRSWRQQVQNIPVERVEAIVHRVRGGKDTFVNLRFGDGPTFENGKRIPVTHSEAKSVQWNLGGTAANGQPLVLVLPTLVGY